MNIMKSEVNETAFDMINGGGGRWWYQGQGLSRRMLLVGERAAIKLH
jgi:hypothetical protein